MSAQAETAAAFTSAEQQLASKQSEAEEQRSAQVSNLPIL
eukprot:COSAG05_NODE_504_length_9208_cov_22.420024_11_plen_40_part_00